MENIGRLLKEKRLELGLTVEQISEKTRLTTKHIKALEEGDISFFKDDLSYLRFFVKSYCEAVGIDFEDIKNDLRECVDDYTMTFTNTMAMQHEEMEKHISNTELSKVSKTNDDRRKIHKKKKPLKKPDFSLVSLIAVVGVVAIVLMLAFVFYLNSNKNSGDGDVTKPPVAQQQTGNGDNTYPTTDDEEEKPEEKKEAVITKNDVTNYTITDYNEGDEFTFATQMIGSNSAYSVTVDGKVLTDPEAKVYYGGKDSAPINAVVKAKKGTKVELYFGYIYDINIKVNDKSVKMDDTIATSGGSYTLVFTFG
ncbi:helix-turn-helix domain-containing protein [[Eubacterium] hominis]|uniref:helix-turn-helix domain-containing protein n=1 Tax=[Eubacterium] hominis TaxID=2764325 RepID=UPI003A4E18A0